MTEAPFFTCPFCGAVSHNPNDVEQRYCGHCDLFVDDEARTYDAIICGELKPDPTHYQAGWAAHAAGKHFHEGPKPHHTVAGLCWRMGWNDRALTERAMGERRTLDDVLGPILSRSEVAAELGMSEAALIAAMAKMPGLTYLRIGRTIAFKDSDVAFIRASLAKATRARAWNADVCTLPTYDIPEAGLSHYWNAHYLRAKRGATVRNLAFNLDVPHMRALIARAAGRCEVSGIPFDESRQEHSTWKPFAPSLDRIVSSKPYEMENCRLVCCAVNIAMGSWGEDVLWTIAAAMMAKGRPSPGAHEQ